MYGGPCKIALVLSAFPSPTLYQLVSVFYWANKFGTPQLEANLSSSGSVIRQMTVVFFNFFNWHTGMYVFQDTKRGKVVYGLNWAPRHHLRAFRFVSISAGEQSASPAPIGEEAGWVAEPVLTLVKRRWSQLLIGLKTLQVSPSLFIPTADWSRLTKYRVRMWIYSYMLRLSYLGLWNVF